MKLFYGLVHKDKNSAFGISFPDLEGCFSAADEEQDVLAAAQQALALYLQDENVVAQPRSVLDLHKDKSVRAELEAGAFLIGVPLISVERKERFNLMLDPALVAGVDFIAKSAGVSRSDYIGQTLKRRLAAEHGAVVSSAGKSLKSKTASKGAKSAAASALSQKKR